MPSTAAAASEALARIEANARATHSDAVLVMRDDEVLLDLDARAEVAPIELMSATKSIVALAVGRLLFDGHLASLDEPVHAFFPEWRQGRKRDITVRMLLDHTSGLQNVGNTDLEIYPAPDVVRLALAAELEADPGTQYAYNNKATNLLSGVVERASGERMDRYLARTLFEPLGIVAGPWYTDEAGNPHGMAGLPLTARDAARLGRLVLDRGLAPDGTRLLDEDFIEAMLAPSARSADVGLLWWRIPRWERYDFNPGALAALRERGADPAFVEALAPLEGQRFDSRDATFAALQTHIGGSDWTARYEEEVSGRGFRFRDIFSSSRGEVVAYRAVGYLGQTIVVVPEKRLVAVRQIVNRREAHVSPHDDYPGFTADVLALAEAL
ncbi:serine hydrolase domain-containing protein [Coralloluteibacterium thermophilus]|uniref:Serine hydrolase domain-containing protein n=1 Tax=Coralloluteibacterium thermophilum TaxID=2707049 RepID=A0ABV9NFS7_9GAMM